MSDDRLYSLAIPASKSRGEKLLRHFMTLISLSNRSYIGSEPLLLVRLDCSKVRSCSASSSQIGTLPLSQMRIEPLPSRMEINLFALSACGEKGISRSPSWKAWKTLCKKMSPGIEKIV